MSLIKFDGDRFVAAMEPGICALVVSEFKLKLESKLNNIVQEVYEEIDLELPDKIKAIIRREFNEVLGENLYNIEVTFNSKKVGINNETN